MKYETTCAIFPIEEIVLEVKKLGLEGWEIKSTSRIDSGTEVWLQRPIEKQNTPKEPNYEAIELRSEANFYKTLVDKQAVTIKKLEGSLPVDLDKIRIAITELDHIQLQLQNHAPYKVRGWIVDECNRLREAIGDKLTRRKRNEAR